MIAQEVSQPAASFAEAAQRQGSRFGVTALLEAIPVSGNQLALLIPAQVHERPDSSVALTASIFDQELPGLHLDLIPSWPAQHRP
jgi:hypothetical protein